MTARDDRLRELAMEATPGPWGLAHTDGQGFAVHHGAHTTVALYADRDDAAYIAAASPDVVLGLLDRLAAAEAERDYHHARADVLLAKVSGRVALRGGKPGDYWAEWHRTHCAAAEAAARAELERDRLVAGIEALAGEWEDRYDASSHMVGCPDGSGYYDLLAGELRALLDDREETP